jgi:hypothetical protein
MMRATIVIGRFCGRHAPKPAWDVGREPNWRMRKKRDRDKRVRRPFTPLLHHCGSGTGRGIGRGGTPVPTGN